VTELSYEDVLAVVERAAPSDRDAAERVLQAVLQTLGERIAAGEARDLATQLPPELSPWVATTTPPERFDVDEFLRRVAERSGTGLAGAERQTRAVFAALGRVLTPDELADVAAELSKDYAPLLPRGPYVEVLPAEAFVQRVAQRAGVDPPRAERATDAVLETLAERITDGEVDDLVSRLPFALHPPLKRGRAHRTDAAARMPLDAFLRHVAELEDVTPQMARHHASAVLATLREAVGDDEFFDVKSQLPGEYAAVLDAR
jgi:uncharacterized protein (DUF2267 family)